MPQAAAAPISGAPRTCMEAIACATSSRVVSRTVAKACGSRVWSITPTDQPSASSQIVRVCLPSTFMCPVITPRGREGKAGLLIARRWPMVRALGGANGGDRLRDRIQQPGAGARAPGNLRALGARCRGLPRQGDDGAARGARAELRGEPAPVHRPVLAAARRHLPAGAVRARRLLALARPVARSEERR